MKHRRKASKQSLKGRDEESLLDNPSPPPSPLPFGLHVENTTSQRTSHTKKHPSIGSSLSFERTSLPPENRFVPQHDPKADTRHVPRAKGALQFVPAYDESTTPTMSSSPSMEEEPPPTWDAIIEADSGRGRSLSWSRKPKIHHSKSRSAERSISSVESGSGIFRRRGNKKPRPSPVRSGDSKSPTKRPLGTALPRHSLSPAKQRPSSRSRSKNVETASAISAASSRRGTRIARLASLFSSRAAVVKCEEKAVATPPSESKQPLMMRKTTTPASPVRSTHSGSSSGYVGWPGTQDKKGETVKMESSYDDSSVGASAFHRKKYELELDEAAVDREVRQWMNEDSFDTSTAASDKLTPLERRFEGSFQSMTEDSYDEDENPADFHLAAVVADATAAARSPLAENTPSSSPMYHSPKARKINGARSAKKASPPRTGLPGYSSTRPRSATKSLSGMSRTGGSSVAATSASGALSIHNLFGDERMVNGVHSSPKRQQLIKEALHDDPWEDSSRPPSSTGTNVSKTSSAFFQTRSGAGQSKYGIRPNMHGASAILRNKSESPARNKPESPTKSSPPKPEQPQPPTEAALAMNDRMSPSPRGINARNVRGYRGYLDKTKDVPNLIDDMDSESVSSKATSVYSTQRRPPVRNSPAPISESRDFDSVSDVFDGLSTSGTEIFSTAGGPEQNGGKTSRLQKENGLNGAKVVRLPGGLTAIQATQSDLDNRKDARDFDENLTNSDLDQFGYSKLPAFREMAAAGRKGNDTATYIPPSDSGRILSPTGRSAIMRAPITSGQRTTPRSMFETTLSMSESGSSLFSENAQFGTIRGYYTGDLSEFCVNPRQVKQLVKRYRQLCPVGSAHLTDEEFQKEEDAKKAFALLEMRSRVMEKDIERGLERQGGTVPVDDLVTTPYNQAAHRVRDAVIVSKAWRDGASPKDVTTAALLTRAEERTYYVKRPIRYRGGRSPLSSLNDSMSVGYYLEPVGWVDDTDFMQLRCPSLGPRCMRGFEMFTIGDCQSILLKLTNERCMDLRDELNDATARQLVAEELLKEEGDAGDSMMTDAEMTYLASMEEVKTISKRLVVAEKAFRLVRERVEKLVAKYETLLVKIDSESNAAPSTILTTGSSYYSDYDSQYSSEDEREKALLARRARRAELRAEVAAREALMAKKEAEKVKEEKQKELEALRQKLTELQTETSTAVAEREADREHTANLAKTIAQETKTAVHDRSPSPRISKERIDGVKQKFRDRMAERLAKTSPAGSQQSSPRRSPPVPERPPERPPERFPEREVPVRNSRLRRTAGEEMIQHLDFYERSLKAVDRTRAADAREL